eukprot:TRINITY_DN2697_c0_g1_i4.p1 TRINITY_DN2697_c0_g1~~TRINITY_DN2697_c0_g1_i4.p1  ORF type:complete len:129 (-),score=14.51 TRINITY_DN2697_c0_g1_i4:71-457(-)
MAWHHGFVELFVCFVLFLIVKLYELIRGSGPQKYAPTTEDGRAKSPKGYEGPEKLDNTFFLIFGHHLVAVFVDEWHNARKVVFWIHLLFFVVYLFGILKSHRVATKVGIAVMYGIDVALIVWAAVRIS